MSRRKRVTGHVGDRIDTNDCTCNHDSLPKISDLELDFFDLLLLDLTRCIAVGYTNGEVNGWDYACTIAEEHVGVFDGPSFFARALAIMRAMKLERPHGFEYMRPGCTRVSRDEQDILSIVHAARTEDAGRLDKEIVKFTTNTAAVRITHAANAFAELCAGFAAMMSNDGTSSTTGAAKIIH